MLQSFQKINESKCLRTTNFVVSLTKYKISLHSYKRQPVIVHSGNVDDINEALKSDIEKYKRTAASVPETSLQKEESLLSTFKEAIDKVLIFDFFLTLLILTWLAAGVTENAIFKSSSLLNSWYPLWPIVFQPAIGILMAGALVSGFTSWLVSRKS